MGEVCVGVVTTVFFAWLVLFPFVDKQGDQVLTLVRVVEDFWHACMVVYL